MSASRLLLENFHLLISSGDPEMVTYKLDLERAINTLTKEEKDMIYLAYISPVDAPRKNGHQGNPGTARYGRMRTWKEMRRDSGRHLNNPVFTQILNSAMDKLDSELAYTGGMND